MDNWRNMKGNGKKKAQEAASNILDNNGETMGKDPQTGRFLPGHKYGKGNAGAEWHSTSVKRMFERIAKASDTTPEEILEQLEAIGFDSAMAGQYPFWRDLVQYVHGKPTETKNINVKGELSVISDTELEEELSGEISEAIGLITGEEEAGAE